MKENDTVHDLMAEETFPVNRFDDGLYLLVMMMVLAFPR